jgi:UDP-2,4-diacetamido-2,4,6-trideoxy-beta-L-altropyranose hydrolase
MNVKNSRSPSDDTNHQKPRAMFRVDAAHRFGHGHLMRCLVLAQRLQQAGWQCHFLTLRWPGDSSAALLRNSHVIHHHLDLPAQFGSMTTVAPDCPSSHEHDVWTAFQHWNAAQLQHAMTNDMSLVTPDAATHHSGTRWDLVVLDHYELDASCEQRLQQHFPECVLLVIDDLANRPHHCDVLLDQNLLPQYQTRYQPWVATNTQLLLGPRFVLLREEFYRIAIPQRHYEQKIVYPDKADESEFFPSTMMKDARCRWRFLVFFGGADADNLTCRAMDALEMLKFTHWHADIVVGQHHPALPFIKSRCDACPQHYSLHVQSNKMATLMAAADLMLGAGGSTHWERAQLQLPAIVVRVAANQAATTALLAAEGICIDAGDHLITVEQLSKVIADLLRKPDTLVRMVQAAQRLWQLPFDDQPQRKALNTLAVDRHQPLSPEVLTTLRGVSAVTAWILLVKQHKTAQPCRGVG